MIKHSDLKKSVTRSGKGSGQLEYELNKFLEFIKEANVKSYLEVGAKYGDTFTDVMLTMPKGSLGVVVDLPGATWGGKESKEYLEEACKELMEKGYKIVCIFGDSTDERIVEKVKALGPFDACLIDGDHRYKGVKKDFENYGGLCKNVAFHDITGSGQRHAQGVNVEVPKLWAEIKGTNYKEFIEPGSKMGIGVIFE
jgi:hypothetical protein